MEMRTLGSTNLRVSAVCMGASPLGGMPLAYGYDVDADTARETVRRVFDSPITFMDTSNNYSNGESERRIGDVIRERGGLPEGFVLATKADPAPGAEEFTAQRVRESFDESMERLGLEHVPLFYFHDPEYYPFEEIVEPGGVLDAMVALREEGLVDYIGVAGAFIPLLLQYLDTDAFDVILNHNAYTLVDQSANELIEATERKGTAFINAAPFGGGILAQGPQKQPRYRYVPANEELTGRVSAMQRLCEEFDIPLAAAALQFSLRDSRVGSTIVGMSKPERVENTLQLASLSIPDELWEGLARI